MKTSKRKPGAARPRNPFAIVLRRRPAGPERSPHAYRRRGKHPGREEPTDGAGNGEGEKTK